MKKLGKISSIKLGRGGYQDAMFGLTISFSFDVCCGIGTFIGTWETRSKHAQYSVEQWEKQMLDVFVKIKELMHDAKVDDFNKLVGVPVEITLENDTFKDFRILTEVL